MHKRRRRRRRRSVIVSPRGTQWAVPSAQPLSVFDLLGDPGAFAQHWDYLHALALERPQMARAILQRTKRLAERYTKRFRKTVQKAVLLALASSPFLGV